MTQDATNKTNTNFGDDLTWSTAISEIIPRFIRMLKTNGVPDPGNYYNTDHYRRTITLFFPLKKMLVLPISIHVSERKWCTSPGRAQEQANAGGNSQLRILRKRGFKIKERMVKDRALYLVCGSFSKSVKGDILTKYSGAKWSVWVIKDVKTALKEIWRSVNKWLSARLLGLKKKLQEKKVSEPYGPVKELKDNLSYYIKFVELTWLA